VSTEQNATITRQIHAESDWLGENMDFDRTQCEENLKAVQRVLEPQLQAIGIRLDEL
jgi:hypothetical protein